MDCAGRGGQTTPPTNTQTDITARGVRSKVGVMGSGVGDDPMGVPSRGRIPQKMADFDSREGLSTSPADPRMDSSAKCVHAKEGVVDSGVRDGFNIRANGLTGVPTRDQASPKIASFTGGEGLLTPPAKSQVDSIVSGERTKAEVSNRGVSMRWQRNALVGGGGCVRQQRLAAAKTCGNIRWWRRAAVVYNDGELWQQRRVMAAVEAMLCYSNGVWRVATAYWGEEGGGDCGSRGDM